MENKNVHTNRRTRAVKRLVGKNLKRSALEKLKLQSKPKCPWCNEALAFLYGGPGIGTISLRCSNCRRIALIDIASSETIKIVGE